MGLCDCHTNDFSMAVILSLQVKTCKMGMIELAQSMFPQGKEVYSGKLVIWRTKTSCLFVGHLYGSSTVESESIILLRYTIIPPKTPENSGIGAAYAGNYKYGNPV